MLTDPFGLSATRIMDSLLSGEPFDEEKSRSLIDRRVKAFKDQVMDTVHGYHILEEQRFMMLTGIYHMLSKNQDFHPDNYEATVNPPKQKPDVLTLDNTLQFLREQGADPETLKLIRQQCTAQAG